MKNIEILKLIFYGSSLFGVRLICDIVSLCNTIFLCNLQCWRWIVCRKLIIIDTINEIIRRNRHPAALTMIRPQHDSGGVTEHRGFTEATDRYTTSNPELSCFLSLDPLCHALFFREMLLLRFKSKSTYINFGMFIIL